MYLCKKDGTPRLNMGAEVRSIFSSAPTKIKHTCSDLLNACRQRDLASKRFIRLHYGNASLFNVLDRVLQAAAQGCRLGQTEPILLSAAAGPRRDTTTEDLARRRGRRRAREDVGGEAAGVRIRRMS